MSKKPIDQRPKARVPKGFRDTGAQECRAMERMLSTIRQVYETYGFEPLATPAIEFTDALGKFLPDQDRPNAGVFSFQDEDEQWMSLRYDLTAPLARYVAENYDALPKPYRRYQTGSVWRNEKPGPGRYREFTQFDADTVGTDNPAADAEMCMLAADTLEALGIPRGSYRMRVNNRKVLDGVMEVAGLDPRSDATASQRLTVLRAIDKLDKFGTEGVRRLLGEGRKDESGDFTKGAGLAPKAIDVILGYVNAKVGKRGETLERIGELVQRSVAGRAGLDELRQMDVILAAAGFAEDRVVMDPGVVRGLEYYTGPVFEAELTFEATNEDGQAVRFGSVGGGGRYDGLVARFKGTTIPATGFSLGVSRLTAALQTLGKAGAAGVGGPVVVLVLDKDRIGDMQRMANALRSAGISAEMYVGTSGMKAQMKYADKRGSPCVVIQGGDEKAKGEVTIKDLIEGARLAEGISDHAQWKEARPAQFSVPEARLVEAVRDVLARRRA